MHPPTLFNLLLHILTLYSLFFQFTANETQKSASASDDENIIGNIVKRIVFSPNPAYRATDDILLKMEEGETLFDISDTVLNDISS